MIMKIVIGKCIVYSLIEALELRNENTTGFAYRIECFIASFSHINKFHHIR